MRTPHFELSPTLEGTEGAEGQKNATSLRLVALNGATMSSSVMGTRVCVDG